MKEETATDKVQMEGKVAADAPLEILDCNHPILRKTSSKVKVIDEATLEIMQDMIKTMLLNDGLGLAAPQVGLSKRFFIIVSNPEALDSEDEILVQVVVNPQILEREGEIIAYEGCLSYPDYVAHVKRAQKIKVRYYDQEMIKVEEELTGMTARAFQHELDHLDGILFTDRMEPDSLKHVDELKPKQVDEDNSETDDLPDTSGR